MAGKRWSGSSFVDHTIKKRWNGSAFVDLTIAKRWDGFTWIDLYTGGGGGLPTGSWDGGNFIELTTSCTYTGGAGCPIVRQLTGSKTFSGTYVSFSIPPTAGITITSIVGTTVNFTANAPRGDSGYYYINLTLTNGVGSVVVPLEVSAIYYYSDESGTPGDPGNEVP